MTMPGSRLAAQPASDIELSQLPPRGRELGRGGQAKVYDLPGMELPDVAGPLVYKEYRQRQSVAQHGMRGIVALRSGLSGDPARKARLDAITTWPLRQVVENVELAGVLLPLIPGAFFHDMLLPSGQRDRVATEVQYLFVQPDRAQLRDHPLPSPDQRLAICRDFAHALAFLHDDMYDTLDIVFGDINAKNALFRLDAEPMVMFVDCDAVRVSGNMGKQLDTPDWNPPKDELPSLKTDRYKLGLFVLRCLTPGKDCSWERDPRRVEKAGVLDVAGMDLLRAAIEGPPAKRPTARQWHSYLCRCLGQAVEPPRLTEVTLDRTVVAAGEPLTLTWTATEAHVLEVSAVGCPTVTVDATAGSGVLAIHPARTGRLTIRVRNPLGEDTATTPPVAVVDVPPMQWLPVPMPTLELPRLDYADLPRISAVMPPVPMPTAASLLPVHDPVGLWTLPSPLDPVVALAVAEPPVVPSAVELTPAVDPPDVLSITTAAPHWDGGPYVRGEVIR